MKKEELARLLIVYEPDHVEAVAAYLKSVDGPHVAVAFNFWAEEALRARGIRCESIENYASSEEETARLFEMATTFAHQWYRLPEMVFFKHRTIPIGEAVEPAVDNYLERVLYLLPIMARILDAHPEANEVVIPHGRRNVPDTAGPLDLFEERAPVDVLRFLSAQRGIAFAAIGEEPVFSTRDAGTSSLRGRMLETLNWIVTHTTRQRPIKIFASEYWFHIEPFIASMKDVEMVLMDRSEVRKIPWRMIFSRRIRFIHPRDVVTGEMRLTASSASAEFRAKWSNAIAALKHFVETLSPGLNWWPIIEGGMTHIVTSYAERVVADAEGIARIIKNEKSNRVLLRASISGRQHHFFTAARIARELGIPSIELQHAGGVMDPRSVLSRIESDYLASYGPLMQKTYQRNHGYNDERIRSIGSARFDRYLTTWGLATQERATALKNLGLDPSRPVILAAVPSEDMGLPLMSLGYKSYDVAGFFRSMRGLRAAFPDIQIIFKFRAGSLAEHHKSFLSALFPEGGFAATDADLFSMLVLSDLACCGNSTTIYEIMISQVPLVLFPWSRSDTYHTMLFDGAVPIAFSDGELIDMTKRIICDPSYREELLRIQKHFLESNLAFDSHASERTSAFIREDLKSFPTESVRSIRDDR